MSVFRVKSTSAEYPDKTGIPWMITITEKSVIKKLDDDDSILAIPFDVCPLNTLDEKEDGTLIGMLRIK